MELHFVGMAVDRDTFIGSLTEHVATLGFAVRPSLVALGCRVDGVPYELKPQRPNGVFDLAFVQENGWTWAAVPWAVLPEQWLNKLHQQHGLPGKRLALAIDDTPDAEPSEAKEWSTNARTPVDLTDEAREIASDWRTAGGPFEPWTLLQELGWAFADMPYRDEGDRTFRHLTPMNGAKQHT